MIFTIGAVLFLFGYLWYRQTEYYGDWRDAAQFGMLVFGIGFMSLSLLTLAWQYLP